MTWQELITNTTLLMETHYQLGILIAGFIAFIESLAIIGSIIPGSVMMTLVGLLLGSGTLPWKSTIISIFIGALIGDYISYWLGKHFKQSILKHRWVAPYQTWIQHGEAFIKKHGILSILAGRFFGPMRSLVPMIAGILNMTVLKFTIAIIPTAALWTIVYLTPGVILGALSSDIQSIQAFRFMFLVLMCSGLFAAWYAIPTITRWLQWKKWFKGHLLSPIEISHLIKSILMGATATALITAQVFEPNWLLDMNASAFRIASALSSTSMINASYAISNIINPIPYLLSTIAITILLYKERPAARTFFIAAMLLFFLTLCAKIYLPFSRPGLSTMSFGLPSGHVLLFPALMMIVCQVAMLQSHALGMLGHRITLLSLGAISISRLILQEHWLSQVTTSAAIVLCLTHGFASMRPLWTSYIPKSKIPHAINTLIVAMACSSIIAPFISPQRQLPKAQPPIFDTFIPTFRPGLIAHSSEPLNIRIYATPDQAANALINNGWKRYDQSSRLYQRLASLWMHPYPYNPVPLIPPLLSDTPPSLILSKQVADEMYTLRLWNNHGQKNLLIGTLSLDKEPAHPWSLANLTCSDSRYNIQQMSLSLVKNGQILKTEPYTQKKQWQPYCWNGEVLILYNK